jgi:hypothetical protein
VYCGSNARRCATDSARKTWPREFAPSTASVSSLSAAVSTSVFDAKLQAVKPSVAVDSLTQLSGPFVIASGQPCGRAKLRSVCKAKYKKALANPTPYGRSNCGRCPLAPQPLALVYTRRDEVRLVTDLKAFLGPIDTAADAAGCLLPEGADKLDDLPSFSGEALTEYRVSVPNSHDNKCTYSLLCWSS